jgi:hypothetical protein
MDVEMRMGYQLFYRRVVIKIAEIKQEKLEHMQEDELRHDRWS